MQQLRQVAKRIDASDVVSLLREVYPEGVRGRNEAEALIAFDREFSDPAPEWRGFMAEAVADHLLRRSLPLGIVSQEKADWLMQAIAPAGREPTSAGIQALIRTIEQATEIPNRLSAFAIRTIWRGVISGHTPLKGKDVVLLRRIIEIGKGAVSADEAEAMFDLHDAVAASEIHSSFEDLFFRAITNYVQGASGYQTQSRLQAMTHEPRCDAGGSVVAECAAWLSTRIMRDGRPTGAERSLLRLLEVSREPDQLHRRSFGWAA